LSTVTAPLVFTEQKQTSRLQISLVILVALAIRLIVVFFTFRSLPDAEKHYEQFGWEIGWVARSLADGHGFSSPFFRLSGPTALVPPLYPMLLSVLFRIFGVYSLSAGFVILSVNSLLSALTTIPVYFSAKYSLGIRGGNIAAWAWALYPFSIYFSACRVWEYALTALLFTTCFCIAQRISYVSNPLSWIGFGLLYGVTALSNPSVLSVMPFLLLYALWRVVPRDLRILRNGTLMVVTTVAVLIPWTLRNYHTLGIVCPVRDNYWLEFYAGNSGDNSDPNPASAHPASNPAEMQEYLSLGEPAYLAEKRDLAIAHVSNHPLNFVGASLRRVVYYWSGFWSFSAEYREREPFEILNIFFCGGITLLMLRGALRFWQFSRRDFLPYLILIVFFPITYYLSHPLIDYRQPIEPAILVLAVAGAFPSKSECLIK
jgi:4-amino-4-deoxy-L-arabinose transferase-like glycosyltransferase